MHELLFLPFSVLKHFRAKLFNKRKKTSGVLFFYEFFFKYWVDEWKNCRDSSKNGCQIRALIDHVLRGSYSYFSPLPDVMFRRSVTLIWNENAIISNAICRCNDHLNKPAEFKAYIVYTFLLRSFFFSLSKKATYVFGSPLVVVYFFR